MGQRIRGYLRSLQVTNRKDKMKEISEAHACVIDAGTFPEMAEVLSRSFARTSYYSPWESEFLCIDKCVIGDGCDGFDRVDDYMDPDFFNTVDLWVFPDIGYGGLQRYLRSLNKLVWGSMGASDLELFRTRFLSVIHKAGLPVVASTRCNGLTELASHLKGVKNKWVKINRYRGNMETWHHIDWDHSVRMIEHLACVFGPMKEYVIFVVQDAIEGDEENPVLEVGYDGWTVDGNFPVLSYQGYEAKNQLYLGSLLAADDIPQPVRFVNEAMAPTLEQYGYRNFWATEIRIQDGTPYFIDPTARMAGQTMEHLHETCTNLADVVYRGAAGELVVPEFSAPFAAEATLHYTAETDGGWKTLKVPESVRDWVKLYRYCCIDGIYQFPPHKSDELGVVCGRGDTVEEAINDLKDNFSEIENEPVSIDLSGFAKLIEQIEDAEAEGVGFSDKPLPDPAIALQ